MEDFESWACLLSICRIVFFYFNYLHDSKTHKLLLPMCSQQPNATIELTKIETKRKRSVWLWFLKIVFCTKKQGEHIWFLFFFFKNMKNIENIQFRKQK